MLRSQKIHERQRSHIRRRGLLYLGAMRELFVISLGVGLVMASLWQASSLLGIHLSPQKTDSQSGDVLPVMNIAVNQEHLTLFTHAMEGKLSQISLESGISTTRPTPKNVNAVAMSADASTVAMLEQWAEDRQIHHRVDVIRNDQIVASEELHLEPYTDASVSISQDGNVVMSFSSLGMSIGWDLTESSPCRWSIDIGPTNHINSVSPDGHRLFVSSKNGHPFLCDSRTGESRILLSQIDKTCQCVAWSADGNRLSIGDFRGGIHVFDALTGQRIWHHKLNFQFAKSVAFSNDSQKLAVGGFDEFIRVWDLARTDQQPIRLKGQRGIIRDLVFTVPNETLISGSFDGTIFEWSLVDQTCIRKFQ